jgi:hypothetical protein
MARYAESPNFIGDKTGGSLNRFVSRLHPECVTSQPLLRD